MNSGEVIKLEFTPLIITVIIQKVSNCQILK